MTVPAVTWQSFTRESGGQKISPLSIEWSRCGRDSKMGKLGIWRQREKSFDNRSSRDSNF